MRVLFVTPYVPSLVRIRSFSFIRHLSRLHEVTVLALQQDRRDIEDVDALHPHCHRLETVRLAKPRSLLNCLSAVPSNTPLQGAYCYSAALRQRVARLLAELPYDLVHVEHLRGAYVAPAISGVATVYDSVDCISLLLERTARHNQSLRNRLVARFELPRTRRYEAAALSSFDRTIVSSDDDRLALQRLSPLAASRVEVVPNGVHLESRPNGDAQRDANSIVFSGKMSYHANVDAIRYFCQDILPLVVAARPDVTLSIIGSNPGRAVTSLQSDPRVRVTGHVPDIQLYLRRAAVAVVPITYAAGIQLKLLEAMAARTPVVATPMACRALSARNGEELLVAERPEDFAGQIIRLLDDVQLRERIGAAGRCYVEDNHDWGAIVARLSQVYEATVAQFRSSRRAA